MPVIISQEYRTTKNLEQGVLVDEKSLEVLTRVYAACECGRSEHTLEFIQEKVQADPEVVPDSFYKLLIVERGWVPPAEREKDPGKYIFFTVECLTDWLKNYRPYPSPIKKKATEQPPVVELFPRKKEGPHEQ